VSRVDSSTAMDLLVLSDFVHAHSSVTLSVEMEMFSDVLNHIYCYFTQAFLLISRLTSSFFHSLVAADHRWLGGWVEYAGSSEWWKKLSIQNVAYRRAWLLDVDPFRLGWMVGSRHCRGQAGRHVAAV